MERDAINPQLQLEGEQINIRADGEGEGRGCQFIRQYSLDKVTTTTKLQYDVSNLRIR